jgi:hypothetical protein
MTLKMVLKKNKYIYDLIKKIRWFQLVYMPYVQEQSVINLKRLLRVFRINQNSPYEKLIGIKNKHLGERCFIIATGPSLTVEDLEKLNGETTFSMNSICLAFDETDWRPTYYGIQDEGVYGKMRKYINKLDAECKFISDNILDAYNINILKDHYIFPIDFLHHFIPNNTNYNTKFSNNIFGAVYNGYTITYSLLQIAVYMGFKEIYLLGVDCHYGNDMKHHFKEYGQVDPDFLIAGQRMVSAYKVAKKYASKHNIKIYNATRGGKLEEFERVDLDKVLQHNQNVTI